MVEDDRYVKPSTGVFHGPASILWLDIQFLIGISTSLDEGESVGDRYLGQNSIPALLREQSSSNEKNDSVDIRQDMRSILGLDTSAPYPLMSSQHLHHLGQDISAELPSDREVMKYVTWTRFSCHAPCCWLA